jgi:uncharacterized protein
MFIKMNRGIKIPEIDVEQYDDLYVLPLGKYFIIYSPLRGITALCDKITVLYLTETLYKNNSDYDIQNAIGFLLKDIYETPPHYPEYPSDIPDPYFLGIIPTRTCSGDCIYCDFDTRTKNNKNMDYQTTIAAIDWMANRMEELHKERLEIHFFGGEPLFAPDIVSVAVHYTKMIANKKGLIPLFEVSTNGLVSDETARFVTEHFHTVVLSLDGPEEIHNLQRPMQNRENSFKLAARFAKKVSQSNSILCLRACISTINVDRMSEITEWFCNTFNPSIIDFENLKSNKKSNLTGVHEPDPVLFAIQYNKSLSIAEKYGVELVNSSIISDQPQYSSCPVGKDTLIVTPEGKICSCYLFPWRWEKKGLDLFVGEIKAGEMQVLPDRILHLRETIKEKPRCSSCFCRWTCAGGCHVDVTYPGAGLEYNNFCRQTRILTIIKILRSLNQREILDTFLQDQQQLINFSMRKSDKLKDWSGNG